MKVIKLINKDLDLELDVNVKDSWEEITLKQYTELSKLGTLDQTNIETILSQICLLTDAKQEDLIDFSSNEIMKISQVIADGIGNQSIPKFLGKFIYIDGQMYVIKSDYSSITLSEQIYIKNIEENEKNETERLLGMLSILIRPGYSKEDASGVRYIQNKIDASDINSRKEIFRTKLPVVTALSVIQSFTNGTRELLKNTKNSSPVPHKRNKSVV